MKNALLLLLVVLGLGLAETGFTQQVSERALRAHIDVLASDAFGGRKVGTAGEARTIAYISEQLGKAGVIPAGDNESWLQPVQLVERRQRNASLAFTIGQTMVRMGRQDVALRGSTDREKLARMRLRLVPLVDDGSTHARGKAALIRLDDPSTDQSAAFLDRAAALARDGAVAVIALTAGEPSWQSLSRRMQEGWVVRSYRSPRVEGAISPEAAKQLTRRVLDGAMLDLAVATDIRRFTSHNIVGRIAGSQPGSGAVLLIAHWDHLGTCAPAQAPDRICNGAVDNASGVAGLIEAGRSLAAGPPLARDVYLLATTAEEPGMLGAQAFADRPPLPLREFVAALNLDSIALAPRGAPLALVGAVNDDLRSAAELIARNREQGIAQAAFAEQFASRQDGWVFAQRGIPAMMATSSFGTASLLDPFIVTRYHRPADNPEAIGDLGGAADDVDFHIALIRRLADPTLFPQRH